MSSSKSVQYVVADVKKARNDFLVSMEHLSLEEKRRVKDLNDKLSGVCTSNAMYIARHYMFIYAQEVESAKEQRAYRLAVEKKLKRLKRPGFASRHY